MAMPTKRSKRRDKRFFERLVETGRPTESALFAGYSRSTAYKYREEDESFREQWDDALAIYQEKLEAEADRRAVEGTAKPVFHNGEQCGEIQQYSDTLLMFRLKKLDPSYRERHEVEHKGKVSAVMVVPGIASVEDWNQAAQDQQRQLKDEVRK